MFICSWFPPHNPSSGHLLSEKNHSQPASHFFYSAFITMSLFYQTYHQLPLSSPACHWVWPPCAHTRWLRVCTLGQPRAKVRFSTQKEGIGLTPVWDHLTHYHNYYWTNLCAWSKYVSSGTKFTILGTSAVTVSRNRRHILLTHDLSPTEPPYRSVIKPWSHKIRQKKLRCDRQISFWGAESWFLY